MRKKEIKFSVHQVKKKTGVYIEDKEEIVKEKDKNMFLEGSVLQLSKSLWVETREKIIKKKKKKRTSDKQKALKNEKVVQSRTVNKIE